MKTNLLCAAHCPCPGFLVCMKRREAAEHWHVHVNSLSALSEDVTVDYIRSCCLSISTVMDSNHEWCAKYIHLH